MAISLAAELLRQLILRLQADPATLHNEPWGEHVGYGLPLGETWNDSRTFPARINAALQHQGLGPAFEISDGLVEVDLEWSGRPAEWRETLVILSPTGNREHLSRDEYGNLNPSDCPVFVASVIPLLTSWVDLATTTAGAAVASGDPAQPPFLAGNQRSKSAPNSAPKRRMIFQRCLGHNSQAVRAVAAACNMAAASQKHSEICSKTMESELNRTVTAKEVKSMLQRMRKYEKRG